MNAITVLFVDDEPINRLIFAKSLEDHVSVIVAESGEEGLRVLTQHPEINLVVSDFSMPGMSGVEFIATLKEIYPAMPCFTHSAVVWDTEIEAAIDAGLVLKHIPKPLVVENFLVELGLAVAPSS